MSTREYKQYPTYKDSGVEWLGEIPAGWEVKRLRFVSASNPVPSEVRSLPGDTEVSFVPMEAVGEHGGLALQTTKLLADVKAGYTYFRDGDVVIAKITPCFENGKGALAEGLTNGIAFGTTELHVLRAREAADRRFAFYATLSDAFRRLGEADMYGAGGQKRISESFVRNFPLALPSLPEQRAIAAFLDRETARIDALVAKKERLITLLQERRAALITRAVTKGLDPNAPKKDSGVEWLGEIPTHWEVKPLKHLTAFATGWTPPTGREDYYGGNHFWANIGDLGARTLTETAKTITDIAVRDARLRIVPAGSLLFSFKLSVGAVSLTGVDMYTNEAIAAFLPSEKIDTDFLYWSAPILVPRNAQDNIYGAPLLSRERIAKAILLAPPVSEQRAIARHLNGETSKIDVIVKRIGDAIVRLHELRTAHISAAVTGKIDAREAIQ